MRQFDVFVFEENGPQFDQWTPTFEDEALGWQHDCDWNRPLQNIDAEWVVIAHPAVHINRDFLNNLAEVIDSFPMVDAFAPRIKYDGHFYGGFLVNESKGFPQISENEKMRYVAAANPLIGVYSSRIIQRTGLFDLDLPPEFRLLDYTLRMAHAGGKMFNVPYLVSQVQNPKEPPSQAISAHSIEQILDGQFLKSKNATLPLWEIFYKNLPATSLVGFTLRHPTMIPKFLGFDKQNKLRHFKRDKATSLSKFTPEYLKEISL